MQSRSQGLVQPMAESLAAFFAIYLMSGFGNAHPVLLALIFYGLFVLRWAFTYDKSWLLFLATLMAVGGMLAEGTLGAFDLVSYRHQDIFYLPWWLGGLYMHGAFALRDGMRYCLYRKERLTN